MKMSRFLPYFGIVGILALGAFIVAFADSVSVLRTSPSVTSTASSSLSVMPGFTLPPLTLPNLKPTETDTPLASSTPITPAPKKVQSPTPPISVPISVLPPLSSRTLLGTAASALIDALVNIICYVPTGSSLHSISGSGVFIDSKGIILTNAHVAQYFLLADRGVSCIIRAGSPAADNYEASLIYISPVWLKTNTTVLTQMNPTGTGEYDFAFLAVTKSIGEGSTSDESALPSSFPFLPLAILPPISGTPVAIASYGAQFLESNQIKLFLFPTLVFGSIKDIFTFAKNTIDVIEFGGSAIAQEGSSGGGVVDARGMLVGTITTSIVEGAIDTRSFNAITASYIRAEYASETGEALDLLLDQPIATSIAEFASLIPMLEAILTLP